MHFTICIRLTFNSVFRIFNSSKSEFLSKKSYVVLPHPICVNKRKRLNEYGAEYWESSSVTPHGTTGDGEPCFFIHLKRQKS
jgi:hypothetical protein